MSVLPESSRWAEVAVSVASGAVLLVAGKVLLPVASVVYRPGGLLFGAVKAISTVGPVTAPTVVAALAGGLSGLVVLYVLDETKRLVGVAVVGLLWSVLVPELQQLDRVVDAVGARPAALAVSAVLVVAVVGGLSLEIYPGIPWGERGTIEYLQWANFRLAIDLLYFIAVGWTVLVTAQYVVSPSADQSPIFVLGTAVLGVLALTVFLQYENRVSVPLVSEDRRLVPYVLGGLYRVAEDRHGGFSIHGNVAQMAQAREYELDRHTDQSAAFGYRVGRVLTRTVRVEATVASPGPGSGDSPAVRATLGNVGRHLFLRLLPQWLAARVPGGDDLVFRRISGAQTVLFAVEYPREGSPQEELLRDLCRLCSRLPGLQVVVALTHTHRVDLTATTGSGPSAYRGAQLLGIDDLDVTVIAVDRDVMSDDHDGGFRELLAAL